MVSEGMAKGAPSCQAALPPSAVFVVVVGVIFLSGNAEGWGVH
jgi:hypothetical protein